MKLNTRLINRIRKEYAGYVLTEKDDAAIEEYGVSVHYNIDPDRRILTGDEIVETIVVLSWGIVQHSDWGESNILIPINSDGYCFKYYDLDGNLKEVNSPEVGVPIQFNPSVDHSLAAGRKQEHPFIAINIDYVAKKTA